MLTGTADVAGCGDGLVASVAELSALLVAED